MILALGANFSHNVVKTGTHGDLPVIFPYFVIYILENITNHDRHYSMPTLITGELFLLFPKYFFEKQVIVHQQLMKS